MKEKCFPQESPLAATVKPSASFDWRSIAAAKSLVLEGISYFIGTGTDTKLLKCPWLNGSPFIHQPSRSHPTAVERFQSVSSIINR